MNKVVYNLVFNRKKKLNAMGKALVQVEAYLNKKKKYFSTKVFLTPEQWDSQRKLVKKHPNAEALNQMIYEYVAEIERRELSLWKQGKIITLEALKDSFTSPIQGTSFLCFFQKEISASNLKESTKKNHLSTYKLISDFKKEILFPDLTFEFIASFEQYLLAKSYHTNTIAKHLKHIKRYINVAINKGYIDISEYAFRKYKIKSVDSHHSYLSPEELNLLERLELPSYCKKLQKTLDAFLFCCYVGLRYSDFVSLNASNIVKINGDTWLIYKSVKTNTEVRSPIYLLFNGKANKILRKYDNKLSFFFLLRNNSNINKELIRLAKLAGLTKRISFHTARHTNATLLIYNGVNITTIQKLLGHKNIKTTQIYANIMDMTIVRDLEKSKLDSLG